jgi:hypothetical protein
MNIYSLNLLPYYLNLLCSLHISPCSPNLFPCSLRFFPCSLRFFPCSLRFYPCSLMPFSCSLTPFLCSLRSFPCSLRLFRCPLNTLFLQSIFPSSLRFHSPPLCAHGVHTNQPKFHLIPAFRTVLYITFHFPTSVPIQPHLFAHNSTINYPSQPFTTLTIIIPSIT